MQFSSFGNKFGRRAGIVSLMDDLGTALRENPDIIFMGGGNPGRLPEVEAVFQQRLEGIMARAGEALGQGKYARAWAELTDGRYQQLLNRNL